MAKTKNTKRTSSNRRRNAASDSVVWNFPLDKTDFTWLAIGIGVVIVGFLLMATGITEEPAVEQGTWNNFLAVNVAPVMLLLGYCVIIPMALFKFFSRRKNSKTTEITDNANDTNNNATNE